MTPVYHTVNYPNDKGDDGKIGYDCPKKYLPARYFNAHVGKQEKYNNRYEGNHVIYIHL
jgi:hypothetical protein